MALRKTPESKSRGTSSMWKLPEAYEVRWDGLPTENSKVRGDGRFHGTCSACPIDVIQFQEGLICLQVPWVCQPKAELSPAAKTRLSPDCSSPPEARLPIPATSPRVIWFATFLTLCSQQSRCEPQPYSEIGCLHQDCVIQRWRKQPIRVHLEAWGLLH